MTRRNLVGDRRLVFCGDLELMLSGSHASHELSCCRSVDHPTFAVVRAELPVVCRKRFRCIAVQHRCGAANFREETLGVKLRSSHGHLLIVNRRSPLAETSSFSPGSFRAGFRISLRFADSPLPLSHGVMAVRYLNNSLLAIVRGVVVAECVKPRCWTYEVDPLMTTLCAFLANADSDSKSEVQLVD